MDEAQVRVRLAAARDAADLQAHCFVRNSVAEVAQRLDAAQAALGAGTGAYFVAEVDGTSVGIAGYLRAAHPLKAHRAELVDVVVGSAYQGRGLSRRMVDACCEHAAQAGIELMETACRGGTPAEQVYPRLGFTAWGRLPRGLVEPWGDRDAYDEVCFYRPLISSS